MTHPFGIRSLAKPLLAAALGLGLLAPRTLSSRECFESEHAFGS